MLFQERSLEFRVWNSNFGTQLRWRLNHLLLFILPKTVPETRGVQLRHGPTELMGWLLEQYIMYFQMEDWLHHWHFPDYWLRKDHPIFSPICSTGASITNLG